MQPALWNAGDAGEHVGEPGQRIDIIELGGHDQRCHDRGAVGSAFGTGEQPGFASQRNYPSILPMSGRMLKSFIAGMRFMDAVFD
ncbi:hypothetical protein ACVWYH_005046 [Bradyrhizobium sp. GM24.11]